MLVSWGQEQHQMRLNTGDIFIHKIYHKRNGLSLNYSQRTDYTNSQSGSKTIPPRTDERYPGHSSQQRGLRQYGLVTIYQMQYGDLSTCSSENIQSISPPSGGIRLEWDSYREQYYLVTRVILLCPIYSVYRSGHEPVATRCMQDQVVHSYTTPKETTQQG